MGWLPAGAPDCWLRERERSINKNCKPDPRELWLGITAEDHLVLHRPNHREKRSYLNVQSWISLPSAPDSRFRLVYAGVDYRDPTYESTPDALWNRSFSLSKSLLLDECIVGRACELFQLPPRFTEEVKLSFERKEKVVWVIGGEQSRVRRQPLAGLEEFISVHLQWIEYKHEREWPAQEKPALQIELTLTFAANTLAFKTGGYSKFGPPGEYDQFCSWCTRLAQEFGAPHSTRRGTKPICYRRGSSTIQPGQAGLSARRSSRNQGGACRLRENRSE